ncbi:MAG: sterol desaturase family protein [Aestuariivirgaceae bacterium]|nr:sterol desaturase family protein [Aestuariivirgaceae bacterium]
MSETGFRLSVFLLIFAAVAYAELRVPKRAKVGDWKQRWRINLSILVLDIVLARLTVGAAALMAATYASTQGVGLFNLIGLPFWANAVLGFILLDLAVYVQHVITHRVPVLWRLHQVHHADEDVDLTTGLRFHPLEIILSLVYKAAIVLALGIDPWAVVLFEAMLNASAVYTHGNYALPVKLDATIRKLFCTPDMHRVHHSIIRAETDSNYGFFLSIWDHMFRTYKPEPALGQSGVVLGLPEYEARPTPNFWQLLKLPFKRARA